jgi:ubiquinone/menaquinone biosynthesis C-methylase UbiE
MKSFEEYYPIEITSEITLGNLIESVANKFPGLLGCLAPDRLSVNELRALFTRLDGESGMFEGGHRGGRGDGYRTGQLTAGVRKVAVRAIDRILGDERKVVIDVLGGNGTLARTLTYLNGPSQHDVLCCDIARDMVAGAYLGGQAAWRQSADLMLLNDACAEAVVFLYGTHHIPRHLLESAFKEAYRVLKTGGRVIVQDLEEGTPSAQWFSVVLHQYTERGHDYRHFVSGEFSQLLQSIGFTTVEEHHLYDPLEVRGPTREAAFAGLLSYLKTTYELTEDGQAILESLVRTYGRCNPDTWNKCICSEADVIPCEDGYEAVMPRMSLIAWGTK